MLAEFCKHCWVRICGGHCDPTTCEHTCSFASSSADLQRGAYRPTRVGEHLVNEFAGVPRSESLVGRCHRPKAQCARGHASMLAFHRARSALRSCETVPGWI